MSIDRMICIAPGVQRTVLASQTIRISAILKLVKLVPGSHIRGPFE